MIIKNSAKCVHCDVEIVSTHRHDFVPHYCVLNPSPAKKWVDDKLVEDEGKITFNFAVDGGEAYIRRCGDGYIDTSVEE